MDNRHGATAFYHYLTPVYPIQKFPLGGDAVFSSLGPADAFVGVSVPDAGPTASVTSSSSLTASAQATITVSSMCDSKGNQKFSSAAGLWLDQFHSDAEAIGVGSFTLNTCTSITLTSRLNHPPGFSVSQNAPLHFSPGNGITFTLPAPGGPSLGHTQPVVIMDNDGHQVGYLEFIGNTTDSFPYNTVRVDTTDSGVSALFSGFSGAPGHEVVNNLNLSRNGSASVCTKMLSSTGAGIFNLCDKRFDPCRPADSESRWIAECWDSYECFQRRICGRQWRTPEYEDRVRRDSCENVHAARWQRQSGDCVNSYDKCGEL